jgi:hypothetical protein
MQRMGTTAHGAVASTNYSPFWLGGAAQRLGERRSLASPKTSFLGSYTTAIQPQKLAQQGRGDLQVSFVNGTLLLHSNVFKFIFFPAF